MNATAWFIGDETSAAGWRLAGVRVTVPESGREIEALQEAMAHAPLVMLESNCARALPAPVLDAAVRSVAPLVLVVPGVTGAADGVDLGAMVRAQLGLGRET